MEIKRKVVSISADELADLEPVVQTFAPEKSGQDKDKKPAIKTPQDRYYLPLLNINHLNEWQPKKGERKMFTDEVAMATCLGNCCGVEGLKGGCCHLDPTDLEHILGPLDEAWITETIRWFRKKGMVYTRQDLVIDFEEGKVIGNTLFKDAPNSQIFQQKEAYPFLRFQVIGPRYTCKFMSPDTYKCQIYEQRPKMCRDYLCQYIVTNFLVKVKSKPNTWQKVR